MKRFYLKLMMFVLGINLCSAQNVDGEILKDYLRNSGMRNADVEGLKIQSMSNSKKSKVINVYAMQEYKNIPVHNAVGSFAIKNGEVVHFAGKYINDLATKVNRINPEINAEEAIRKAVAILELGNAGGLDVIERKSGNDILFSGGDVSVDNIPVRLMYQQKDDRLILSWDLSIHTVDGKNWYSVRVDAKDGKLLEKNDWILECTFENHGHAQVKSKEINTTSVLESKAESANMVMNPSYRVFPLPYVESPNHGARQLVSGQEDNEASPFGWHDTNGVAGAEHTTTTGNNVLATEDRNGNNGVGHRPNGGADLIFDYDYDASDRIADYEDASITNLFYVNNVIHDVWYKYGFDEESGNFQTNNYGKGGTGNDHVLADAQDGSGLNNATFGTPPDGFNPVMSMFVWNPDEVVRFTINNTSIAGNYGAIDNNFFPGNVQPPLLPAGITADVALAIDDNADPDPNDACSAITNGAELDGKIAVVRRGSCNFTAKVIACQNAGAVAVLVVNNQDGNITMGGGDGAITIPAMSINRTDGEIIISALSSESMNATIGRVRIEDYVAEDGSFDNGIIAHEYGHGISNRLTGGPANASCLGNIEQMGEGWSDWVALMMTIEPGDQGTDARGIGTFAIGQPTTGGGIRPFPYSTDMTVNPVTYEDVANEAQFTRPHGIGSIWAAILWDLSWAFIERDGFDADLYNGNGGNNLAMQLVMDGMKLQSCSPGFVDGRDGILAAADQLPNSEANKCLIWEVFARRGVGYSADQGSSNNRTDQTVAFDMPPASELDCQTLGTDDFNEGVFIIEPNPSNGVFNIRVKQNIGNSAITIYDLNGRTVFKQNAQLENVYQVSADLNAGVYVLRIEAEDGSAVTTSKLVVQ